MSLSLITLLMYFRVYSRHRWLSALGVLGAAFLLFLSHSYTYQIGAIIGVLLIPLHQITNLFNKHEFNLRTVLYLLIMTLSVVFVSFIFANLESIIIPTFGKGSTFNGRVPIWNLAIEQLMKRPLLGYGYSSFWSSYEGSWIYQKIPWAVTARRGDVTSWHAHNAFIDLALQLGLIGLAMLFVNIALVFYRAISLMNASQGLESLWMLQVLSIQLIASSSEAPTYLSGFSVYWVIYVAMAFSSATLLHKMHQSRRSFPMLLLVH